MAIIKQTKRTSTIYGLVGILAVASSLLVPPALAVEETVKFRAVVFFTKMEEIQVGDIEGHRIGVFAQKGLSFYESGEIAIIINRCIFSNL